MRQLRKVGVYFLLLGFIAILILVSMRLFGPRIGNTFSTISNCLPDAVPCVITPTTVSVSATESSDSGSSPVEEQLERVDQVLNQSIQSSIAYNVPETVALDKAVTIELLLNPSASPTQLAGQIIENGEIVTATIEITPMMKAELIPQDGEALTIQPIHSDAVQLVGSADTTRWSWLVTARKSGPQKVLLVIHRLIKFEGQDYWREVKAYEALLDVQVPWVQRLQPWGWITGVFVAVLFAFLLWRQYDPRKRRTGHIFISYRRSDSADITGRIYDRLVEEFGRAPIFKDVDSIPLGTNFKDYLDRNVSECNVLLAVIGNHWLAPSEQTGKHRLEDPQDFVRLEIESALEKGIPVIPLLVQGASMPEEKDLPASLKKLVYQNGIPIRPDPDFHRDMDRLISALGQYLK